MLNRRINVLKADGTWGPAEVTVDNYTSHDYVAPVPKSLKEAETIREKIAEDFEDNKPRKQHRYNKRRSQSNSFSYIMIKGGDVNKELVYRRKRASDFKMYSDGTWDYDVVESEDKNNKYVE